MKKIIPTKVSSFFKGRSEFATSIALVALGAFALITLGGLIGHNSGKIAKDMISIWDWLGSFGSLLSGAGAIMAVFIALSAVDTWKHQIKYQQLHADHRLLIKELREINRILVRLSSKYIPTAIAVLESAKKDQNEANVNDENHSRWEKLRHDMQEYESGNHILVKLRYQIAPLAKGQGTMHNTKLHCMIQQYAILAAPYLNLIDEIHSSDLDEAVKKFPFNYIYSLDQKMADIYEMVYKAMLNCKLRAKYNEIESEIINEWL